MFQHEQCIYYMHNDHEHKDTRAKKQQNKVISNDGNHHHSSSYGTGWSLQPMHGLEWFGHNYPTILCEAHCEGTFAFWAIGSALGNNPQVNCHRVSGCCAGCWFLGHLNISSHSGIVVHDKVQPWRKIKNTHAHAHTHIYIYICIYTYIYIYISIYLSICK